jgi:hypothetical protein
MTRPCFVSSYYSILAQKEKNFGFTTHGCAVGIGGVSSLPASEARMSSRFPQNDMADSALLPFIVLFSPYFCYKSFGIDYFREDQT